MKRKVWVLIIGFLAFTISDQIMAGSTLEKVKSQGFVQCGVSMGLLGFSNQDSDGNWVGFDVDVCRAVAAALFGDANKVKYSSLRTEVSFSALASGEVDILSRTSTWTASRDTALGIKFVAVSYYDGQGFLVRKSSGVKTAKELKSIVVCMQTKGTSTSELNLVDYFKIHGMKYTLSYYRTTKTILQGLASGRCNMISSDQSQLSASKVQLGDPDIVILPETISKEPLGPAVAQGDDAWFNLVRWSLFAMVNAEELGISSQNITEKMKSNNPAIRRLLGLEGKFGENLKTNNRWAYNIIAQVGNYAESFERNLGKDSQLKLPRGLNALWNQGGIMYAPPIR